MGYLIQHIVPWLVHTVIKSLSMGKIIFKQHIKHHNQEDSLKISYMEEQKSK